MHICALYNEKVRTPPTAKNQYLSSCGVTLFSLRMHELYCNVYSKVLNGHFPPCSTLLIANHNFLPTKIISRVME